MTAEEIVAELQGQYPLGVKILADGSVACLVDLVTTRSIMLGCDEISFTRRFCFLDRSVADREWEKLMSQNDVPTGYTARRPQQEDVADPYLNELHGRPWNKRYERAR